ncbi:MAG: hypothetical protein OHK0029_41540 [Armatimonadaceae bacterium]
MSEADWNDKVRILATQDWARVAQTERELAAAGSAGMEAVLQGLTDPDPTIRRACARFMDHYGTDQSISGLLRAIKDPVPKVRREAVHSLSCNRCKEEALCVDLVPILAEVLDTEENVRVRCEAVFGLHQLPPDERIPPILRKLQEHETDARLLKLTHYARKHHDPEYRREVDEAARHRASNSGK